MSADTELGTGRTCFVVSPIGNRFEPPGSRGRTSFEENIQMWEEVIQPACDAVGLTAVRADRIAESGDITDQVFDYLRTAEIVIADLSHGNPNVMYELGLRHSRPGITIQIGEYEQLPFDVNTIRTLQFRRTPAGLIAIRNELIEALRAALNSNTPTQLRATAAFSAPLGAALVDVPADAAKSAAPEPDDEVDEPAMLEILAEGEEAATSVAGTLEASGATLEEISAIIQAATGQLADADARRQGFAGRLTVARRLAANLETPAQSFSEQASDFHQRVSSMDAMMDLIIGRVESGYENVQDAREFFEMTTALVEAAESSALLITGFRDAVRETRRISNSMGPVSRSLEASSGKFLQGIALMSGWRTRIAAIVGQDS